MQKRVDREMRSGAKIAALSPREAAVQRSGLEPLELVTHLSFALFVAGTVARPLGQ